MDGKWEEVSKLHENVMDFLASDMVKNTLRLIIPTPLDDLKFRKDTQFCLEMCKDIWPTYDQNEI